MKPGAPETSKTRLLWPIGVAAALAAVPSFATIDESDLGWHIALGRRMLSGGIVRTNALTWTNPDYPWYPTSWLYDVAVAWLDAHLDLRGIQALTFLVVAATAAIIAYACRRLDTKWGAWLGPLLVLLLSPRITLRPHVVTWLLLAAIHALCTGPEEVRRSRRWLAVGLIAIAGNFHSGAFFGALQLSLFAAEAAWKSGRWRSEGAIISASIVALCANPGGIYNLGYIVANLHAAKVFDILEMGPATPLKTPAFFVCLPFAIAAAWTRRRDRPSWLIATLAFGALGRFAVRQTVDFWVVVMPFLADGLARLRAAGNGRTAGLAVGLAAAAGAQSASAGFIALSFKAAWDSEALPVQAVEYVREKGVSGKGWNSYDDGGYLEYALPGVPAFQDGREQAFPPEFFRDGVRAEHAAETFAAYLRERGVEWVLVRRHPVSGHAVAGQLIEGTEWARVYWDPQSEVLIRRDIPRFASLIRSDEFQHFVPVGSVRARVIEAARTLDAIGLREYSAEVDRYLRWSPGDRFGLLARCALDARQGKVSAVGACNAALDAAASADEVQLAGEARSIPPFAPSAP